MYKQTENAFFEEEDLDSGLQLSEEGQTSISKMKESKKISSQLKR